MVVDDVEVVFVTSLHVVEELVDLFVKGGRGRSLGRVVAPTVRHDLVE